MMRLLISFEVLCASKHFFYKLSYVTDISNKDKKAKGTKKHVIKRKYKFEYYKNCLKAAEPTRKNQANIDSLKKIITNL